MKKFLLVTLVLILPFVFLGCGDEKAKNNKTLYVGMSMDFPPFEFTESRDKNVKGFDVDIMRAIGKELGYDIVFNDIGFDDLLNVLEKGNVDAVISAVTITGEREIKVDFTKPYYESGLAIAVRRNNNDIQNFTDLPGKKIAVVVGTTSAVEMREQKSINVIELPTNADAFYSLLSGNVDAVISDKPIIDYYLNTNEGVNIKTLPILFKREYYGIAIRKNNKEFLDSVDDALQKIKDKGVYDNIYEKWFGEIKR